MAKFSIELGSMLMAHIHLTDEYLGKESDKIHITDGGTGSMDYSTHSFDYLKKMNPNHLVETHAADFMLSHLTDLPASYTDDAQINLEINNKMLATFVRHFYGYEIGYADPLYWWVQLQAFFDEYLPIFIKDYQQVFIKDQAFITNLGHADSDTKTTGNAKNDTSQNGHNSSINGDADTPQNELNFKLNTGDPAQDYNFNYSSQVSGAKGASDVKSNSNTNTTGDSHTVTDTKGRNATIMDLVNQLESFANGAYINLFNHAMAYQLFMGTWG